MIEGSAVRIAMNGENKERPGAVFIGQMAVVDYGGVQVIGRWYRKDLKEDGPKDVAVTKVDVHTFFPWTSVDYIEVLPESVPAESGFAESYRQGMQSLKNKDYTAAARHFREALAAKPGDTKSKYYLEEAERLSTGT